MTISRSTQRNPQRGAARTRRDAERRDAERRAPRRLHVVRMLAPDLDDHWVDGDHASPPLRRLRLPKLDTVPGGPHWSTAMLVAILVAALVALGVTGQRWYHRQRLDAAHAAASTAARETTVDFVSISATTVDRDLQRIASGATGDFKDEFARTMTQVRAAVVENNVESHGTVLRSGLVSGNLHAAVVLVAVDATVKNVRAPKGVLTHYRIQVDVALDPTTGRWLVSRLQFVG
jgi:hypothetical protein